MYTNELNKNEFNITKQHT